MSNPTVKKILEDSLQRLKSRYQEEVERLNSIKHMAKATDKNIRLLEDEIIAVEKALADQK